jgi:hypothetical protein
MKRLFGYQHGMMARRAEQGKRRLRPKTGREQERKAPRSELPIHREAPARPGLPAAAPERSPDPLLVEAFRTDPAVCVAELNLFLTVRPHCFNHW